MIKIEYYNDLSNIIVFDTISSSIVKNITSGTGSVVSFTIPNKDGYKPIILIYRSNNQSPRLVPFNTAALITSSTAELGVFNAATFDITTVTASAILLYKKIV